MRMRFNTRGRKTKSSVVWSMKTQPKCVLPKRTLQEDTVHTVFPSYSTRAKSRNLPSSSYMASDYSENDPSYVANLSSPDWQEHSINGPTRRPKYPKPDEYATPLSSPQKRSGTTSSIETYGTNRKFLKQSRSVPQSDKLRGLSTSTTQMRSRGRHLRKLTTETHPPPSFSPRRLRVRRSHVILDSSFMSMDSLIDDHYLQTRQRSVYDPKKTRSIRLTSDTRRRSKSVLTQRKGHVAASVASGSIGVNHNDIPVSVGQQGSSERATHSQVDQIQHAGEEAFDDAYEDEENKQPDGRRYPVRNRRNTTVYQVECNTQSTHGPHRDWLAGTGFDGDRRRSRYRSHRRLEHCGSSTPTSSSSTCDSEASTHQRPSFSRFKHHSSTHGKSAGDTTIPVSEDVNEIRFARRFTKSIINARSELLPINMSREDAKVKSILNTRLLSATNLADIEPMSIDDSVGFEQVGGHDKHIESLKECILLPLMYPEVFSQFNIDPPRGVLFSGPPGTGKTLLARALANECGRLASNSSNDATSSLAHRPIAFFMRKGADCLSKWVGESERQLRLLFDQAYLMRPSIIFFDEIDGLAPVRSSRQDQIHSSIVSTLLSLMDGLDHRTEVVVIGATNRPDVIDPALRRPGRFDREFAFQLPPEPVRLRILQVHTAKWQPKLELEQLQELAYATVNFSGADLKALVTEACLCCLRRRYPQVYVSQVKLALERKYLVVTRSDWLQALRIVRPSNDRSGVDCSIGGLSPSACALASAHRSPLQSVASKILLTEPVNRLVNWLAASLHPTHHYHMQSVGDAFPSSVYAVGKRALLLYGDLPANLISAVWHRLESVQVFTLDFTNLVAFPTAVGIFPEAAIAQIASAVRRSVTSATAQMLNVVTSSASQSLPLNSLPGVILYLPCIDILLNRIPRQTSVYLIDRLVSLLYDCHNSQELTDPYHCTVTLSGQQLSGHPHQQPLLLVATLHRPVTDKTRPADPPSSSVGNSGAFSVPTSQRPHASTGVFSGSRDTSTERLINGLCSTVSPQKVSRTALGSLSSNSICHAVPLQTNHDQVINGELSGNHHSPASPAFSVDSMWSNTNSETSRVNMVNTIGKSSPTDGTSLLEHEKDHPNRRLARSLLCRLFQPTNSFNLCINTPSLKSRKSLFTGLLDIVCQQHNEERQKLPSGKRVKTSNRKSLTSEGRAPSPPPATKAGNGSVAALNALSMPRQPRYSPPQLLALEREEAQLFRRLRQVLRRVVAHLARYRRFAVFTRPVQVDDAPDYYNVIQKPMDLGSIRDRIDAHYYTDVTNFMRDIELIYHNALEYNPANVPRSREIRSRASEFWDEACLQLEEELHPADLDERCRAALEAQKARQSYVSDINPSNVCSSSVTGQPSVKPPLPMPLGGRYSRRLHGEAPTPSPDDHQLEVVTPERKSRRRSQSSSTKDFGLQKPNSTASVDDNHMDTRVGSPTLSETINHYVLGEDSDLPVAGQQNCSGNVDTEFSLDVVIETFPCSTSTVPTSVVLGDDQVDISHQHGDPAEGVASGVESVKYTNLSDFCHRLTKETQGWMSDQILCLYDQLALLCQHHRQQSIAPNDASGKRFDLLTELDRLFSKHCTQEVSEHVL